MQIFNKSQKQAAVYEHQQKSDEQPRVQREEPCKVDDGILGKKQNNRDVLEFRLC